MSRVHDRLESATLLLTRSGPIKDRLNGAWRQYLANLDPDDVPSRILVRTGHPGRTTRVIEYIVKGSGPMTVTYDSAKGGRAAATVTLK